jgi:hypothetical protein
MLADHNYRWGDGSDPTRYVIVANNRRQGVPPLLLLASVLDPRIKDKLHTVGIEEGSNTETALWELLKKKIIEMVKEERVAARGREEQGAAAGGGEQGVENEVVVVDLDDDDDDDDDNFMAKLNQRTRTSIGSGGGSRGGGGGGVASSGGGGGGGGAFDPLSDLFLNERIEAEFCLYKAAEGLDFCSGTKATKTYHDPLVWYKEIGHQFPMVARLARRLLAIPASSAPAERIFSVSGNVITKKRARLDPDTARHLVFLHGSWQLVDEHEAEQRKKGKKG